MLAYSGGLDTSVAIRWLSDRGWDVAALLVDIGQGADVRSAARRARAIGARRILVRDLRRLFAQEFILPALQAHAVYEGRYYLATALSRPLIARALVEAAHQVRARAVAHGCTGKGNDQVRFEVGVRALDPRLEIVAPVRQWEFRSRQEELAYARRHGVPLEASAGRLYSIDRNLWGVSIEGGSLEDPWAPPPESAYLMTRPTRRRGAQTLRIRFARGTPVALDGRRMALVALIERLNRLGGAWAIGRSDLVENRLVGIKSREVYEAPAAAILLAAHRDLESLVLDRALGHYKESLASDYARLIYDGLWFTPLKAALDAFVAQTQRAVTGEVRVLLRPGQVVCTGRRSPVSLYRHDLATYGRGDRFNQRWAEGFIALWGMPYVGRGQRKDV